MPPRGTAWQVMFYHAHDPTGELVDRLAHELSAAYLGRSSTPEKRGGFTSPSGR